MTPEYQAKAIIDSFHTKSDRKKWYNALKRKLTIFANYHYNRGYKGGAADEDIKKAREAGYRAGIVVGKAQVSKTRVTNQALADAFGINIRTLEYRLKEWGDIKMALLEPVKPPKGNKNGPL